MTVSGTGDNVVIGVGSADTSTGGSMTLIGVSSSNAYSSVVSLTAELSSAMDRGSTSIRCDVDFEQCSWYCDRRISSTH